MPFRIILILIFLVVACSEKREFSYKGPRIGELVEHYNASLASQTTRSNYFYFADSKQKKLILMQKEPFKFVKTLNISESFGAKSLIASPDARYALVIGDNTYGIWHEDGRFDLEPVSIVGEVKSVSYLPEEHLMVMQGQYNSIVFVQFTETGDIARSQVLGPVLETERVVSGNLVNGGIFLAGTSSGRLLKVNIDEVLTSGEWSYELFAEFEESSIQWVAADKREGENDRIWIYANDQISVLDLETKEVLEVVNLEDYEVIGFGALNIPHLIAVPRQEVGVSFEDEEDTAHTQIEVETPKTQKTEMRSASIVFYASKSKVVETLEADYQISGGAILDKQGEYMISTSSNNRIRLKDGLVTDVFESEEGGSVVYDEEFYYRIYESPLGFAEKWRFGVQEPLQILKRFYFDEIIE